MIGAAQLNPIPEQLTPHIIALGLSPSTGRLRVSRFE
ncbi:hypothetical protein PHLH4_30940 [Pseudomonas sp. St316]|nr:hypothetical protein PHLH4_30940 [Pseudomonas sp. St316]